MVQNIERTRNTSPFPEAAPAANPVFYRTYSRRGEKVAGVRETWDEVCDRTLGGIIQLGKLTADEAALVGKMQRQLKSLPSGRWLWVGGTAWVEKPENFSGAYNCTSTNVVDWRAFGLMMDLAMMGCGTGAVLEPKYISQLPPIRNRLTVKTQGEIGITPAPQRRDETAVSIDGNQVTIQVGDSRQGWVKSYQTLMELSTDERFVGDVEVVIDLSDVRPVGEQLKGFGGVANPVRLPGLYDRCATILNRALGRQLSSVECCLLIDEAAACVVAGNIRRCLPEDALVHTASGLVPIRDVRIGDLVQTPLGLRPVVDTFDQGFQEVYEIETSATTPRATLNHRQAVLANVGGGIIWKPVANLAPGDRLLHNTQVLPGTITHLPAPRPTHHTSIKKSIKKFVNPLVIPDLSPAIAWLIGFTQGNGSVTLEHTPPRQPYGQVEWAMHQADDLLLLRLREKLDAALALFGLTVFHNYIEGEITAKSVCSSMQLAEYFHTHVRPSSTPLAVPPFILQGTVEIRAAYLAGLMDSNGLAQNRSPHRVTTVYRSFARQIGAVLSSLGIAGQLTLTPSQEPGWQAKYTLTVPALTVPSLKARYDALIASHSVKGEIVPAGRMQAVYAYSDLRAIGLPGSPQVEANYERYRVAAEPGDTPVMVKGLGSYDYVRTYDIEVEEAHCFYCDGYLTHNSAGMRQFDSEDGAAATAKDNLWMQDAEGNWRIDPERDVLRMANHTRVFHRKPTLEECVEAVRKQYYSGEGAIQWAGEAERRAGGEGRYGLNPCVTADTWIHTEHGPRQVHDLIGKQHSTYVNGELFSTTPDGFFYSGTKPVLNLMTQEGYTLRLTGNHRVLKVTAQTQKAQYVDWVAAEDLQPGDRILLHNHRDLIPWDGNGRMEDGWLLGSLLGDGSLAKTPWNDTAILCYWEDTQDEMSQSAVSSLQTSVGYTPTTPEACYHKQLKHRVIRSTGLAKLAAQFGIVPGQKQITPAIEAGSYAFYQGFLKGLFDADGSVQGTQAQGISVRLAQSNLDTLKAVQRMLARLGIISTLYQQRRPGGYRLMPDGDRCLAPYYCETQHELVIANDNLYWFAQLIGFQEPRKAEKLTAALEGYKRQLNRERFAVTVASIAAGGFEAVYDCTVPGSACFDANSFVAHNCGEILGENFHCNLAEVHLNQLDPHNFRDQEEAFIAGALSVAALLNHRFQEPRYQRSREEDPIVGVSFTGLFDFFVHAFGVEWLQWWAQGRPDTVTGLEFKEREQHYLSFWKDTVHRTVWDYCDRHHINRPNRCTTVQPAGTKSLLTGASPGWHPPKAQRFIRRITFRKNDPVALACLDYGYPIVPSQSDKDDNGNLLNDPFDPRCTEWLVEIPVEVSWANLPGADAIAIEKFSALAQFDFYMQVQKHYTAHNTSATIELYEEEIEPLAQRIYAAIAQDEGYISAALLARFNAPFPRLPFEKIDRATYVQLQHDVQVRQRTDDFYTALTRYDSGELSVEGPAGCDSDKCMLPEQKG